MTRDEDYGNSGINVFELSKQIEAGIASKIYVQDDNIRLSLCDLF